MSTNYPLHKAVAGDPDSIDYVKLNANVNAASIDSTVAAIHNQVLSTNRTWEGEAGAAYRRWMARQETGPQLVAALLRAYEREVAAFATSLRNAQREMETALSALDAIGIGRNVAISHFTKVNDTQYRFEPGDNAKVLEFLQQNQGQAADLQRSRMEALQAFAFADQAHARLQREIGAIRGRLSRLLVPELTPEALRKDIADAQRDNPGYSWLAKDDMARMFLERYTRPDGPHDLRTEDGSELSNYLKNNPELRGKLGEIMTSEARLALTLHQAGMPVTAQQRTDTMEIGADCRLVGCYVTGHALLHGTNQTVGGLGIEYSPIVTTLPDGSYRVTLDAQYGWHDVMDINRTYLSDRVLGAVYDGTPYKVHIYWNGRSTYEFAPDGTLIRAVGGPHPAGE